MTQRKDGGPAFPCKREYTQQERQLGYGKGADFFYEKGMTLRDWFAGMALQGILSDTSSTSRGCSEAVANDLANGKEPATFLRISSEAAYCYADAMLKEREK